jgi:hypothetical protein
VIDAARRFARCIPTTTAPPRDRESENWDGSRVWVSCGASLNEGLPTLDRLEDRSRRRVCVSTLLVIGTEEMS